jgi:hypothetical protein
MLQSKSIDLFIELISEYIPEYNTSSLEQVTNDIKNLLDLTSIVEDKTQSITERLQALNITKQDIIDIYLSELSLIYLDKPDKLDGIMELLLNDKKSDFRAYIEEAELLKIAFLHSERKARKAMLQELELQIEEEELQIVFNRIERKEKKKELQAVEESIEISRASSYFQQNDSQQVKYNTRTPIFHFFKSNAFRIAATLIYLAIPSGLLYMYFQGGGSNAVKPNGGGSVVKPNKEQGGKTGKNSNKNNQSATDYFAVNLVDINMPVALQSSKIMAAKPTLVSQGFGGPAEEEISVSVISFSKQIEYLREREKLLKKQIKVLKVKKFKHKSSTLDSLSQALNKIEKLTQELKIQDFTYRFKNKNLSIFFIKNKDLQKMKVFNYNSQGTDQFYLYFEEKYYLISESASKLVALQDEDSISKLDEIQ